jgi:DTW domain-containing protein YfiP
MSRRANDEARCKSCRMHESLCVCALIPRVETRTRLVLVIHRIEVRKTTNTGALAAKCLPNSEVLIRGYKDRPEPPLTWPEGSQPVLLFPFEDAQPLERFAGGDKPVTLIVPDGNWRQASKVRNRVAGLKDVPCVSIPAGDRTEYRLREELREEGLATIEAIARAMAVLEGKHVEDALLFIFRAMVERTLWSRGDVRDHEVTGGVPEGAMRHDPRSGLAR